MEAIATTVFSKSLHLQPTRDLSQGLKVDAPSK